MLLIEKQDIHLPELRTKFFEDMYEEVFPAVAIFVRHRNGSLQDAKDIFHDALIILYEKMLNNTLPVEVPADRYLVGIAKHIWIRKFNRDKSVVPLDETEAAITIPDDYFPAPNDQKLLTLLEQTGKRCLDMLRSIYYDKLSVHKVAELFGYRSVHSASVQKFKCLEKMRDIVKRKLIHHEDFFE
ncbi:MAG TPA: sigma-70 family RNA polymerase sigma factor [Ohtaekwangia sp.]